MTGLVDSQASSAGNRGGKMLRGSYDEDSEFQNKLNFPKHRPATKSKSNVPQMPATTDLLKKGATT